MKIGTSLRSSYSVADPREGARWMVERAAAARAAGLDSLFVGDHHGTGPVPYYQNSSILGRLLAEWGDRPAGALYLLPLWNPVLVAEQVGTLAALAQGPFILQCAVGGGDDQFAAMGAPLKGRAGVFEHHLDVIRRLLAGEEVDGSRIAPTTPEPLEVWIGGHAPAALDRAARLGDGWILAPWATDVEAAELAAGYRSVCEKHGRTPTTLAIRRDVHVGADEADARKVAAPVLDGGYRGMDPAATVVGGPGRWPTASPPTPRWGTPTCSSATSPTTRTRCWRPSPAWSRCAATWPRCERRAGGARRRRRGADRRFPPGVPGFLQPALAALAAGVVIAAVGVAASPDEHPKIASRSIAPASVAATPITVEPPPTVVPDDSGIPGVVAWETRGWPANTGPAVPGALPHNHADGPIRYAVTPPAGGDHNSRWLNCGVYDEPVASERAGHNLEHGAVWITYRPSLPRRDVVALERFVRRQPLVVVTKAGVRVETHERYIDMSPFPGLPAPIVISSWAHQLRVDRPDDPRLQRYIDTFRVNVRYSPEYGPTCEGQPEAIGGRPAFR